MTEQQGPPGEGRPPTEEELRAAYEAELKRLRVDDVIVQTVVSLLNLGGRRAGLVPGSEDEKDLEQVRQAVEGVRALLPLVEPLLGPDARQLQDALSQLQLAYAKEAGAAPAAAQPEQPGEPDQAGPGPAQQSGRLWVPGS
ncbi:MAG TPA: hypothetical protein VFT42_07640 [Solirubrobacteraceae bacterium]|nr:hypothetical protein [Solirubrobacteraceae bacterium]